MKCFRWRAADQCGSDRRLKCALRDRGLGGDIFTDATLTSATIYSPGFNRGRYFNRNFCIYNISLQCPDELVELEPTHTTTNLSDSHNCRDYLSFHVDSERQPLMRLCGGDVTDPTKYNTDIPSSNFYGILWTNDNEHQTGRFEIKAKCKRSTSQVPIFQQGSGDNILANPN